MVQEADTKTHRNDEQVRNQAIRLFTFLRELVALQSKTVRTIDQYEKVLWFNNVPRESGCHCIAWGQVEGDEESEVWIEIRKPRLKSPPVVPEVLKPWLDHRVVEDSSKEIPVLRDRIIVNAPAEVGEDGSVEPRTVFSELAESPEIRSLWERYVEEKWKPWAGEDRRLQAVQRVYTELFSIYQKQQRLGESYEVVVGLGYLTWKTRNGHELKRHIITAQTSLAFNSKQGVITVRPAAEGAKPALEQDMLEPQDRPDIAEQNAIEGQVTEIGDTLWDGVQLQEAVKSWVHAVSPHGQFDQTLAPQLEVGSNPRIHLAPAVILRKRTERSVLRVLQEIIAQLRDGESVPVGVKRLVTIMDDIPGSEDETTTGEHREGEARPGPQEIYFPLPANDEQLEIVRRVATRQGVLVQGPPGTGKSHTIANLVCHLLATGQRVLVTSHTARALKVLRNQFPRVIADLCVILLGDDLNALEALEDSVRGITNRYNSWDPARNRRLIADLEKKLDEARRGEASTLGKLRALREAETYRHSLSFGIYQGTARTIAERLKQEEPRYSWLSVSPEETQEPPLSDTEAVELLGLLRKIDKPREGELTKHLVNPDPLPSPRDFVRLVQKEINARIEHERAIDQRRHQAFSRLTAVPRDIRSELIHRLLTLRASYEAVTRHVQHWAKDAAIQVLADRDRAWRDLLTVTRQYLEAIGDRARLASELQISGLGERDRNTVKAHAEALLHHLEAGRWLGFGPFRPKVVREAKYLVAEVRIDGHLCKKPESLRRLINKIEVAEILNALRREWSRCTNPPSGTFTTQVAEYEDLCEPLEQALELHEQLEALKQMVSEIPGLLEPTWHNTGDLQALQQAAEAVRLEEEVAEARSEFDHLESHLRPTASNPNSHPVVGLALQAVQTRDEQRYAEVYQILCGLRESREELEHRSHLRHRLEVAAPGLALDLASGYSLPVWDTRVSEFTAAWNWARADCWLRRLNEPHAQARLSSELDRSRIQISGLISDLAAAKAWRHCLTRLTEHERQHLMAWKEAIRRVGRGTGRYARMHRKSARGHMGECRSAIPAWIMPIYRVAETVRPGTDAFDVVIVDEASQSGPEALFLQYLAKKILVVGDDKQISPDFVGITREDVELLRQRHIRDIPHSDALGVDTSFFAQAEIRYGGRIRLREHFRCMPEIIQFSNNLCYRSEPLVPLRQYGSQRLTPTVVVRHIPNGYQKGKSPKVINPPEAEALVDQIRKCCEDPAYSGKSMGVISLLGEDQAKEIEKQLLENIGPEEMERRDLVCGDAYAFQGAERDVMFLSLVSAVTEGQRIGTLTASAHERRFNVAASRAKDQMWLFHTATLNDLNTSCLRYRLLQYCLNPQVEQTTMEGLNVDEIRVVARTSSRTPDNHPPPFESWFEVDVFLKIIDRGYRVIPQFEVHGRRIDLVIEGMQGRLAVECDGDTWHGVVQYEKDVARQRDLERCKWTFWRVRGSTFYRDRDAALEGLWNTLDRLRIYPSSQSDGLPREQTDPGQGQLAHKTAPTVEVGDHEEHSAQEHGREKSEVIDEAKTAGTRPMRPRSTELEPSDAQHSFLSPYSRWARRPVPDPRTAPQFDVARGLAEIIAAEGPMVCHRAYRIYLEAAGIGNVEIERTQFEVFQNFNRAIRLAKSLRWIEERNEFGTYDQINQIVRKAGTPAVLLRTLGNRTFEDIPPAEIGELMKRLRTLEPKLEDEAFLQSVLKHYEIEDMTPGMRARLSQIKAQYVDG